MRTRKKMKMMMATMIMRMKEMKTNCDIIKPQIDFLTFSNVVKHQ